MRRYRKIATSKGRRPKKTGGNRGSAPPQSNETEQLQPNEGAAQHFFQTLYGKDARGYLTIWTKRDRKTHWFRANDLRKAAAHAAKCALKDDVYFGVGLHPRALETNARGKAGDVSAIPGLWLDLDIAGSGHKDTRYPQTQKGALDFLSAVELTPSVIVNSGGGLHAYWLFPELWYLEKENDRQLAMRLSKGWQAHVQRLAEERGWHLDSTHDLARVLRIPGTINHKDSPRLVRILAEDTECRYPTDTFSEYATQPKASGDSKQTKSQANKQLRAPRDEVSIAKHLLWHLKPERADVYDTWLEVGMALHSVAKGLLTEWELWSQQSSSYEEGECKLKWSGFSREQSGVGLGSLAYWVVEDTPWPALLQLREYSLPEFPQDRLPPWLRDLVTAIAEFTQTPVDLAGMLALAILSTAAARKYEIQVWPNYVEPLNLYIVVCQGPATRKSAVFAVMTRPVQEHERSLQEEARPQISAASEEKRLAEQRLRRLESTASKEQDPATRKEIEVEAIQLSDELELLAIPSLPRLIVDDATPEKLVSLLAEHGERIAANNRCHPH